MTIRTILGLAALMLAIIAVTAVPALAGLDADGSTTTPEPTVLIDTGVSVGDGVGISAYSVTLGD